MATQRSASVFNNKMPTTADDSADHDTKTDPAQADQAPTTKQGLSGTRPPIEPETLTREHVVFVLFGIGIALFVVYRAAMIFGG